MEVVDVLWRDGHSYHYRKSKTVEQVGGIYLTEETQEFSLFVEILKKGRNIGKPCRKRHAKKYNRPLCLPDCIEVGEVLFTPDKHMGIHMSTQCDEAGQLIDYEGFIEEHTAWAVYRDDHYIPIGTKVIAEVLGETLDDTIVLPGWRSGDRVRYARIAETGLGTMSNDGTTLIPPTLTKGDVVMIRDGMGGRPVNSMEGGPDLRFFYESEILAKIA